MFLTRVLGSAAVASVLIVSGPMRAATIHVPGDYPTIQAGIDAASDGDEVVVAAGTWTGEGNRDIDFLGKSITVRSASGRSSCIIDCQSQGRGFYVSGDAMASPVLEGFTIRNGLVSSDLPGGNRGGGVYALANVTIRSCNVSNCRTADGADGDTGEDGGDGGGIYLEAVGTLIDCTVTSNRTGQGGNGDGRGGRGGHGGGVYAGVAVVVRNCTISDNETGAGNDGIDGGSGGFGGAIWCDGSLDLADCTISANRTGDGAYGWEGGTGGAGGHGGGIWGKFASIARCTIVSNVCGDGGGGDWYGASGGSGGGVGVGWFGAGEIRDCVISRNEAGEMGHGRFGNGKPGRGGGVFAHAESFRLANCTLVENRSTGYGYGAGAAIRLEPTTTEAALEVTNCVLAENEASYAIAVSEGPGDVRIGNCTVASNPVGGLYVDSEREPVTVVNSIFWMNNISGPVDLSYTLIDADPMFEDPGNGDYHLARGSPCVDAGDNDAVPEDVTTDLDGNPRFEDDPDTRDTGYGDPPIVDLGAYELQGASCPADLDDSGVMDFGDVLVILGAWGNAGGPEDLDGSGVVDFGDILFVLGAWGEWCPGPTGACCFDDGSCTDGVTDPACVHMDGFYRGDGTTCADPCLGACCFDDGTCIDGVAERTCLQLDGLYQGGGSWCAYGCPVGACCFDEACVDSISERACAASGGVYQGDGTTCADTCLGACCFDDGSCNDGVTESICLQVGGLYQGGGSRCADGCPVGACCFDEDCVESITERGCTVIGGSYRGDGTTCASACFGACCFGGEICLDGVTVAWCETNGGMYQDEGSDCADGCVGPCGGLLLRAPLVWHGDALDEENDCPLRVARDVQFDVVIPAAGDWEFHAQGDGFFEVALYIDNDRCCGDEFFSEGTAPSLLMTDLAAGQLVFVTIEALGGWDPLFLRVTQVR